MQKINFSVNINATKDKVWKTLWDDAGYRNWTSVFSETSYADTDWSEGSKALFLDAKGEGMVARIETNRPSEFMSIRHLGMIKDGVEDTTSDEVKKWAGATENYTLKEADGATELIIDMDVTEDHKDYFINTWPKALERLKKLAESN